MGTGVLFSFLQYKLCIGPLRSLDSTFQYFPFHCWQILLSSALDVHTCQSKYMGAFDSSVTQVYGSCTGIWEQYIRQGPGGFEAGAQSLYSWSTHQLMRGAPSLHCTMRCLYSWIPLYLKWPCIRFRGINFPPVSIEFKLRVDILSQTLMIQGDNLSSCVIYRGIKEGKS